MTVTLDRLSPPSLPEALGIPGARSVSLSDPDGPAVLWWAGLDEAGTRQAAAVAALATAAIALAGPVDELGDIILTSAEAFHVIRLVGDGTDHVAHLTLDRAAANLAMARRDFRLVVAGYAARPRHAADPEPLDPHDAPDTHDVPDHYDAPGRQDVARAQPSNAPRQPADPDEAVPEQAGTSQPVLVKPVPPGTPVAAAAPVPPAPEEAPRELPRRERSEPPDATEEVTDPPADWFASLIQAPFANDETILDRILVTLRTL